MTGISVKKIIRMGKIQIVFNFMPQTARIYAVWDFLMISSAHIIPQLEMTYEEKIMVVVGGAGYLPAINEM